VTTQESNALCQGPAGPYVVAAEHVDDPEVSHQLAEQVFILTGRHI
jgi:hypothetical protein